MEAALGEILEPGEDAQWNKFLTFFLGKEAYGIDIQYVTEIIGIQTITEVPEMPRFIKGIINLRGRIIPVMDVRLRFKKEAREYDNRTCIIVIEIRDILLGLIIDGVSEVLAIPDGDIVPPPEITKGYHTHFIKGIGKVESGVKLLLDCDKLLTTDEVEALEIRQIS